jgi:uncharacterized peroxidase-related enzyme
MTTPNTGKNLFTPVTKDTAPEASLPVLEHVEKIFGFVPNLMGTLANSPAAAKGYHALISEFVNCSLTPQEQQVVLLVVSVENRGSYCTGAHSAAAKSRAHVPTEIIDAIRNRQFLSDPKLNALAALTRELVRDRGYADHETFQAFFAAGYRNDQVLEILLGIAVKTISNYLDHISAIALDPAFQGVEAS